MITMMIRKDGHNGCLTDGTRQSERNGDVSMADKDREPNQGEVIIYQSENGDTKIDVHFVDETVENRHSSLTGPATLPATHHRR